MKKLLILIALLAFVMPAYAGDIDIQDGGTRVGQATHLNFGTGFSASLSGRTATVEYSATDGSSWDLEVMSASTDTLTSADARKFLVYTYPSAGATDNLVTITLPAAESGVEFCVIDGGRPASSGPAARYLQLDPASTADTIKYLTLDGGDKIKSAGATGDCIKIIGTDSNVWYISDMGAAAWTDGGV